MAQLNFNASEVAPDAGYGDPIPEGWYNVMADDSEIKPASNNATTGNCFLSMRFTVLDGEHKGRKLFTRFNIRNSNPVAQEIAYKQLSAVAHAVGVLMVQDSQQLHAIPLKVRVKVKPAQLKDKNDPSGEKYDASNEIVSYKNINEVVQQVAAAPAAQGFPASTPGGFAGFAAPAPAAAPAAPAGFAQAPVQQFQAPAAQAAPAAPNPAQWAQPAVQQFAPPVQQAAAAPAFQGFQAPEQQFQQPAAQAPQQFAPPQFSPPVQQAAPVQQFAAPVQQAPAQQQAPAAAPAAAPAQSATPPWARPAA